jgi:hypothetical protein
MKDSLLYVSQPGVRRGYGGVYLWRDLEILKIAGFFEN